MSLAVLKSDLALSSAAQRYVHDFRRRIDANGKHVANAIGDDQLAVISLVKA